MSIKRAKKTRLTAGEYRASLRLDLNAFIGKDPATAFRRNGHIEIIAAALEE